MKRPQDLSPNELEQEYERTTDLAKAARAARSFCSKAIERLQRYYQVCEQHKPTGLMAETGQLAHLSLHDLNDLVSKLGEIEAEQMPRFLALNKERVSRAKKSGGREVKVTQ